MKTSLIQSLPGQVKQGKAALESRGQAKKHQNPKNTSPGAVPHNLVYTLSPLMCLVHFFVWDNLGTHVIFLFMYVWLTSFLAIISLLCTLLLSFMNVCITHLDCTVNIWESQNLFCYNVISVLFIHLTLPWTFDFLNDHI